MSRSGRLPQFFKNSRCCDWRFLFLFGFLAFERSFAAAPTLEYLFPVAWSRGTKENITLGGKFEPWPVTIWTDCSGLTFLGATNSGKMSVEVAKDAPIGPHLLRIYNSEGASVPRIFVISSVADLPEKEPNDSTKQAQHIEKLPLTIGGRLEKSGDVDFFSLQLEAGKWFVAKVDAYSLGSPIDAALHLLDERGVRVAFCHDDGPRLDPVLAYRVEKSGAYFLEIAGFVNPPAADIRYAGSPATVYRLALTQGPFIKHFFPAGIRRGRKTSLEALGWNLPPATRETVDASTLDPNTETTFVSIETPESRIPVVISDTEEVVEVEPNNSITNAQSISVPCTVNGRTAPAGDQDRFQFHAKKGDSFHLHLDSASLGFSLEPWMRVEDVTGKQIAPGDRGSTEAKLDWTAPSDGIYCIVVADLFHHGGDDYGYRLGIGPAKPDFRAVVAEDSIRIVSGETNALKIDITRLNNYTNALAISVEGLPKGISAKPPEIPAKNGEISLPFIASADALPTNQPIRILVRATNGNGPKNHRAIYDLRGKESPGDRLINDTDQIWLTVAPRASTPAKAADKK